MFASLLLATVLQTNSADAVTVKRLHDRGLTELGAYSYLSELTTQIGGRPAGSPEAAQAVEWAERSMKAAGLVNVRRVPCKVPHWVRGNRERASFTDANGVGSSLSVAALGGSIGTLGRGVDGDVVMVKSLAEVAKLGEKVRGKIVFYNRPFDQTLQSTFAMYGAAGDQRFAGPALAAKFGAAGVFVRSLTSATDDAPHTGATRFPKDGPFAPCAALGIRSATQLEDALRRGPVKAHLELSCKSLPEVDSASVVGDIPGAEHPDEVIVVGGHLDSWDLGQGAHDDGAGVTQSIEAGRLLVSLGIKPKRTIRIVAFMDEEFGGRGAEAYAAEAKANTKEKPYAGIESDSGGFMPRTFGVAEPMTARLRAWQPLLQTFGIERVTSGGGGADVGPLAALGAITIGLEPDDARYFDYHHSRNDTLDKVHPRELEMGALAMASLAWLISEKGF